MTTYHVRPGAEVPARCEEPDSCPEDLHYFSREEAFEALEDDESSSSSVEALPSDFFDEDGAATFPPGAYWFGDPSYVGAQDSAWDEWVRVAGETSRDFTDPLAGALYYCYPLVGADTAYGDGVFTGSDGLSYPVDGGMLGPVPVELIEYLKLDKDRLHALGSWFTLDEPAVLSRTPDGTISFGPLTIKTGDDE